jgi:hypothetical protein
MLVLYKVDTISSKYNLFYPWQEKGDILIQVTA